MGDSWAQGQWDKVLDFWGHDDFRVRVYGSFLVSFLAYWGVGALFLLVDYTGKPRFLLRYRVQDGVKTYPVI